MSNKLVLFLSPPFIETFPDALRSLDKKWNPIVVVPTGPVENLQCQPRTFNLTIVNLLDEKALDEVVQKTHTCFIETHTDFKNIKQVEVAQGCSIGRACKRAAVSHVIMSAQTHCERVIGVPAKHYDGKAEILEFMRQDLDLPLTVISIPPYFEFFLSFLRPQKNDKNAYELVLPTSSSAPLDMISLEDVGYCLIPIIENPSVFLGKTVTLCAEKIFGKQAVTTFNEILHPLKFIHKQVTIQQFREKGFPGSIDYANMFDFRSRVDLKGSPSGTRELFGAVQSLSEWTARHKILLSSAMDEQAVTTINSVVL